MQERSYRLNWVFSFVYKHKQRRCVWLHAAPNPVGGSFSILNENEMPHPVPDVKVCKDFLPESSHYIIPELSDVLVNLQMHSRPQFRDSRKTVHKNV